MLPVNSEDWPGITADEPLPTSPGEPPGEPDWVLEFKLGFTSVDGFTVETGAPDKPSVFLIFANSSLDANALGLSSLLGTFGLYFPRDSPFR